MAAKKKSMWVVNLRTITQYKITFDEPITKKELLARLADENWECITDIEGFVDSPDCEELECEYNGDGVQ